MKRILIIVLFTVGCTAHAESKEKVYSISTATLPEAITTGSDAEFKLTITPNAPWVLKTTTPLKIILEASDGIALVKKKFSNKDIVDEKSDEESDAKSVKAPFKANARGQQKINADLTFFLCTEEICQRYTDEAELSLQIN
ncbi:MAG: hypothetical protein V3T05_03325 [Myxococcota bacterium]